MNIDVIVAEIGSTITTVSAFHNIDAPDPVFIAQGRAPTTVAEGDVNQGINNALADLRKTLHTDNIDCREFFAASSAAGGLKMSVHGLVYDMTVKAAKEAALGAGANISFLSAGILGAGELEELRRKNINIIMIAGGVDYGEKTTALTNARNIAALKLDIPVIYAGNIVNQNEVNIIFENFGQKRFLHITDNVYPKIDILNAGKARLIIQDIFEQHIIKAPGMERIRNIVDGPIMPTPGAVMEATIILHDLLGGIVTIDVGGATTDVHSAAEDGQYAARYSLSPEPLFKRTVEGDLGLYINKHNVINAVGHEALCRRLNVTKDELDVLVENFPFIPGKDDMGLLRIMTTYCVRTALVRHAGTMTTAFTARGKITAVSGKDLTDVPYVVGTGGVLSRPDIGAAVIKDVLRQSQKDSLIPPAEAAVLIDRHYIMAPLGVLAKKYPEAARRLLLNNFGLNEVS